MQTNKSNCRMCEKPLLPQEFAVFQVECMKENSGIGIYFDNWCDACRDAFLQSDVDDDLNELLLKWIEENKVGRMSSSRTK